MFEQIFSFYPVGFKYSSGVNNSIKLGNNKEMSIGQPCQESKKRKQKTKKPLEQTKWLLCIYFFAWKIK